MYNAISNDESDFNTPSKVLKRRSGILILTLFSSGVNLMVKVIGRPGPTLLPTVEGEIILKYGESSWVTFTKRGT